MSAITMVYCEPIMDDHLALRESWGDGSLISGREVGLMVEEEEDAMATVVEGLGVDVVTTPGSGGERMVVVRGFRRGRSVGGMLERR